MVEDANLPPDLPTTNELQAGSFRPPPHLLHPAYKGSSGSAGKLCREKINGDPQHSGLPPTNQSSSAAPPC